MASTSGEPGAGQARRAGPGLPPASPTQHGRADAARNHQRVLEAAARLADTYGIAKLQMDDVAREAGVGVGTVYRRFGDRAGLIVAMVDAEEHRFQEAFLFGPPPLGPGAPARERIEAFLRALLTRVEERGEAVLVAETSSPHARFSRAYALHHTHLTALLAEVAPNADLPWLADALLAPLAASLLIHQTQTRGMSSDRIVKGVIALLDAAIAAAQR